MHLDPDHAHHDLDLIAGLAGADLTSTEQLRARAQVHACSECSALRDDLVAIAAATSALPAEPAPRDFRLTAEQAARLRRTTWVTRLLGPVAAAGSIARPLAATFTTLGLVGIFVAAALPGLVGAGAMSAAPESGAGTTSATLAPAAQGGGVMGPTLASAAAALASAAAVDQGFGAKDNVDASGAPADVHAGADGDAAGSSAGVRTDGSTADAREFGRVADTQPVNLLLWGSITVLGLGLMLFALRFAGRRLR